MPGRCILAPNYPLQWPNDGELTLRQVSGGVPQCPLTGYRSPMAVELAPLHASGIVSVFTYRL